MSALLALLLAAPVMAAPVAVSTGAVDADDRRRALTFVDILLQDSNYPEAERFIAENKDAYPPAKDWLLRLATIRAAQGDPGAAAAIYRQLLAENGEDAGLLLELGINALAAGGYAAAEDALTHAQRLSRDPLPPFYLSELAYDRGDEAAGRRWAEAALKAFPKKEQPGQARQKLHLRARLGFDDRIDQAFQKLAKDDPKDPEILFEWASTLLRERLPEAAREPLALLAERFPGVERRRDILEARRLQLAGDPAAYSAFLAEGVRRWPDEPALAYLLGEDALNARRCAESETLLRRAAASPKYAAPALDLLEDAHRQCDHQLGPVLGWRDSTTSRILQESLVYRGYPRQGLRVESEAGSGQFSLPASGVRRTASGAHALVEADGALWTAGGDLDLRTGSGVSAVSPGLLAARHPAGGWTVGAQAYARRQWVDSGEAVSAGLKADSLVLSASGNPLPPLSLGLQVRGDRLTERGGTSARQSTILPSAAWTFLSKPFHISAGYRFVAQDAKGDDAFFAAFPLLRRSRTHYASLDASKRLLGGRLLADATVFNGQDDSRGQRFFSGDLLGAGLSVDWRVGPVRLTASYSLSRDQAGGIAGRSQAVQAGVLWRWDPRAADDKVTK